jgi:signal transduction histidine kinase
MKFLKKIGNQLNISAQCKKYRLPLWQCPQFLFVLMGAIIICSSLSAYGVANRHVDDPMLVALITIVLTSVLFVLAIIITNSMEKLAEASRMKSEFISIATHQLRSPLSNLRWIVELLMSGKIGKVDKKQTEYFRILKENIYRMNELISDLLTVSRIEASKLPMKKRKISLKKLVDSLVLEYRSFAKASNVEILLNCQENLPKINSDPFQVKLVIDNLMDNAIRYIQDRGKVEIKLSKKGRNLHFSIKDNGVGIPEEDCSYIFKKFYRSDNVLKYQTQGSGLGLYLSKSIIERLKGKIGFSSKENVGSTFWFNLPIK